jgi:hypothetical protein
MAMTATRTVTMIGVETMIETIAETVERAAMIAENAVIRVKVEATAGVTNGNIRG